MAAKPIITDEEFSKLISQSNLILSEQEVAEIKPQIGEAIKAVQVLSELDTKGVPTLDHPTGDLHNVMREDVVEPSFSQETALSGASSVHNGFFVVGAVFDE